MATTTKKRNFAAIENDDDAIGRFVNQPGQIRNMTPDSVKARSNKEFGKLESMMKKTPATKKASPKKK